MAQIDTQQFLDIAEKAGEVAFWDLETTGLGADYQFAVLATVKPFGKKPITLIGDRFNKDKKLVREAKELLEKYAVLVAHNGKMFDIPFLNTRLLYWGHPPLNPKHHLDTYQQLKYKLRTSSKSQAALLSFLHLPQQKMHLSPEVWANCLDDQKEMDRLIRRNVTDCVGLEQLYRKTRHLFRELKVG